MDYSIERLDLATDSLPPSFDTALSHWQGLRAGCRCPAWRDLDMMTLPLDIVPWCAVMDVVDGGEDYVFRFFGTARVRLQGRDYTRRSLFEFSAPDMIEKVIGELRAVMDSGAPQLFATTVRTDARRIPDMVYKSLRLSFADADGEDVGTIMTLVDYPSVSRLLYDWFGMEPPIDLIGGEFDDC